MSKFTGQAVVTENMHKEDLGAASLRKVLLQDKLADLRHTGGNEPSLDGRIILYELNDAGEQVQIGKIDYQLKTIHKVNGQVKYQFKDDAFFAFCEEISTANPILLIGYDIEEETGYWIHMSRALVLSLKDRQKTLTFDNQNIIKTIKESYKSDIPLSPSSLKPPYYIARREIYDKHKQAIIDMSLGGYSQVNPEESGRAIIVAHTLFIDKITLIKRCLNKVNTSSEKKAVLKSLYESSTLLWHFISNSEKDQRIKFLSPTEIRTMLSHHRDVAVGHKAFQSIVSINDRTPQTFDIINLMISLYSKESGPILTLLRNLFDNPNTSKSVIKRILVKVIRTEASKHPFVKTSILELLGKIATPNNKNMIFEIINLCLSQDDTSNDETAGGTTLALTLQGRDLDNQVFGEALDLLGLLASQEKYTHEAIGFICTLLNQELQTEESGGDGNEAKNTSSQDAVIRKDSTIRDDAGDDDFRHELKYEYDRKKRYKGELRRGLDALQDKATIVNLLDYLLSQKRQSYYSIVFSFITDHIGEYLEYAEKLVFTKEIRNIWYIRDRYLQNLITLYLTKIPNKAEYFIKATQEEQDEETIAKLLVALPKDLQTPTIAQRLNEYLTKHQKSLEITKHVTYTSRSRTKAPMDKFNDKSPEEVATILQESVGDSIRDTYDTRDNIRGYISQDPTKAIKLLENLQGVSVDDTIVDSIVYAYFEETKELNTTNTKISAILKIFDLTKSLGGGGNVSIARAIRDVARKEGIKELKNESFELFQSLKATTLTLSHDSDPKHDSERTNEERYDSALTHAINSVRGIIGEVLVLLLHFYPDEADIERRLVELSDDSTTAVRSNIILNLRLLLHSKYELCKNMVDKYTNERTLGIDYVLTHHFPWLQDHIADVKGIIRNMLMGATHNEIQGSLGNLVAQLMTHRVLDYEDLANDIMDVKLGTPDAIKGFTQGALNELGKALKLDSKEAIDLLYGYLQRLTDIKDPELNSDIFHRIGVFFLRKKELPVDKFKRLYEDGFIQSMISKSPKRVDFHQYLAGYIEEMITQDHAYLEEGISVLYALADQGIIFSGRLMGDHVAKVIKACLDKQEQLPPNILRKVIEITNKGLEIGYDKFYEIYREYFESGKVQIPQD